MNARTCWEQEYNRPNGLSVEKAPKSDLYLYDWFYSAVLCYINLSEEANNKLVSFLWNCRMKDRDDTRRGGIGNDQMYQIK